MQWKPSTRYAIAWKLACVLEPDSLQEAVKKHKASQAELDALVQTLESL